MEPEALILCSQKQQIGSALSQIIQIHTILSHLI
jgi:hypothetical protein